jgi:hypothetical protein
VFIASRLVKTSRRGANLDANLCANLCASLRANPSANVREPGLRGG